MSAIETEVGVGDCPKRPEGFGHIWAGATASGDARNPCRFCNTSGRKFFQQACEARTIAGAQLPIAPGSGAQAWGSKGMPAEMQARAAVIVEDKKRRDREAVEAGSARPGQVAGAPKGSKS